MEEKSAIGIVGLGVMGKSLCRNLASKGTIVSMYNRHVPYKEEKIALSLKNEYPELSKAKAFDNLNEFISSLETPRKIILMVSAGPAVDAVIDQMLPILSHGDILIDGGNSHYQSTQRRQEKLRNHSIHLLAAGISGGEKGALKGPSIMPSGMRNVYEKVQPLLEVMSAKDEEGNPCCSYLGKESSGHFIKMIHNGIEYAEMQLLAECYSLLKNAGNSNEDIANILENWREKNDGFLLKITIKILQKKEGDRYLLDVILDKAGNKGTGKWTTQTAADFGLPATMVTAALFARFLSYFKGARMAAEKTYGRVIRNFKVDLEALEKAYTFGRIINHHQGFDMIDQVSKKQQWKVPLNEVARIWTAGCIIQSTLMKEICKVMDEGTPLIMQKPWQTALTENHTALKSIIIQCVNNEIPAPCLTEALTYFHGLKTGRGEAHLIQAQRDFFGAHSYQIIDDASENYHHTEWE